MGRKSQLLMTLAVVLAVIGVVAWRVERRPHIAATFGDVSRGAISREVLTSGTLEPAREVETGAQVSGTVQSVHADFNARVKAGEILAELDPSVFDAAVAQARAQVIQADADVEAKQVVLDDATVKATRARALRQQDLIAQAELDAAALAAQQATADLRSAKAASTSARAALAQAQLDRSHTVIRSPIDGIVVNRSVEVGQTLASRLEAPVLFRIADLRKMQMLTDVSEAEVGSVRSGSDVRFQIESMGPEQFHGTVTEVRLQPMYESGTTGTSGTTAPAGTPQPVGSTGQQPAGSTGTTGANAAPTSGSSSQGSGSQSGSGAPGGSSNAQSSANQSASTAATPPAGAVVSYTAIVNVDNPDGRIAPGTTAIVSLPTAQRSDVLRVPNNALSFRPSPAALEATGQESLTVAPERGPETDPAKGRTGYVWKFENGKFTPVEVRTGVSDETWTEILSGPLQPGDKLVTAASVSR